MYLPYLSPQIDSECKKYPQECISHHKTTDRGDFLACSVEKLKMDMFGGRHLLFDP